MIWTVEELEALFGPPAKPLTQAASGVSIDTRTLQAGDLFIAIQGDRLDGHDYVEHAFAAGACAALVARPGDISAPLFVVDDTLRAMERLAKAARARSRANILAITGSVGKTSTKEMARAALSSIGLTHASPASFNNHWGVPLSLCRMPREAAYALFEIGMNHAGEITPLVGFVRPHVAMITTIGPVHIENFASLEGIADAKAEIFSGLVPGGVAVINSQAPLFSRLAQAAHTCGAQLLTFGSSGDARLLSLEPFAKGSHVHAGIRGESVSFTLHAPGEPMAYNAVGMLLACQALGAPLSACVEGLQSFVPVEGRGAQHTLYTQEGAFTVIDESYNASPVSMQAALAVLGNMPGRRIAVLGDMLELGTHSEALHAGLAPHLRNVECLFCVGPRMRALYEEAPSHMRVAHVERAEDLGGILLNHIRAGDMLMIKGSNGTKMGTIMRFLCENFAKNPIVEG